LYINRAKKGEILKKATFFLYQKKSFQVHDFGLEELWQQTLVSPHKTRISLFVTCSRSILWPKSSFWVFHTE